jgi:tRNA nucleotidyltransferase/poly(A) polymerase
MADTGPDLFETQTDLFGPAEQPSYLPDPEKVRTELHKILAEARTATVLPWKSRQVSLYRTIFPQMTNWLPDDEAAQLRFEFEAEIVRLEAA